MKGAMLALSIFVYVASAQDADPRIVQTSYGEQSPVFANVTNTNVHVTYNNYCPSGAYRTDGMSSLASSAFIGTSSYSFGRGTTAIDSSSLLFPTLAEAGAGRNADATVIKGFDIITGRTGSSIESSLYRNDLITVPDPTSALANREKYALSGSFAGAVQSTGFDWSLKTFSATIIDGSKLSIDASPTFDLLHRSANGLQVDSAFYTPPRSSDLYGSQFTVDGLRPKGELLIITSTSTGLEWLPKTSTAGGTDSKLLFSGASTSDVLHSYQPAGILAVDNSIQRSSAITDTLQIKLETFQPRQALLIGGADASPVFEESLRIGISGVAGINSGVLSSSGYDAARFYSAPVSASVDLSTPVYRNLTSSSALQTNDGIRSIPWSLGSTATKVDLESPIKNVLANVISGSGYDALSKALADAIADGQVITGWAFTHSPASQSIR